MWCANQVADLLAKDAAETARLPAATRAWLEQRSLQLKEVAMFVGRLTYEANAHAMPDGTVRRDSQALAPSFRSVRHIAKSKRNPPGSRGGLAKIPNPANCAGGKGSRSGCGRVWRTCSFSVSQPNLARASAKQRKAKVLLEDRSEASFQAWWRESRDQRLKPRDELRKTGSQVLADIRARIIAKQDASVC